jgi:regulator of sigma E protease
MGQAVLVGMTKVRDALADAYRNLMRALTRTRTEMAGPIVVGTAARNVATDSPAALLGLLALLSLTLAVWNTFPVPLLDGGELWFLGIEKLLGRPVTTKARWIAYGVGLMLILVVTTCAAFNP